MPDSPKTKVKLTFRCVEYHTFIREVETAKIDELADKPGELSDWLHSEFRDDSASDSDIMTDSYDLDEFETVEEEEA